MVVLVIVVVNKLGILVVTVIASEHFCEVVRCLGGSGLLVTNESCIHPMLEVFLRFLNGILDTSLGYLLRTAV